MSRKSMLHQNHSNGLAGPEGALGLLLERALGIREEVVASLQSTQGSIQVEALSRRLLENHIHTITHIVQQLSTNMQALESQIAQRDSLAVQSLDQKSREGIGDLRGRVARCDASIARVSADVNSGGQQVRRLQQEVTELRAILDVRLKMMETKLCQAIDKVERSVTENLKQQKTSMSDLRGQVQLLENRHSAELKEAKGNVARLRRWSEEQLQAMVRTHTQEHLKLQALLEDQLLDAESRSKEHMRVLEARLDSLEVQQGRILHQRQRDQQKNPESKLILQRRIKSLEGSLQEELQQLKLETHKGFKYVHDAIEFLKQIGDSSRHSRDSTNPVMRRPQEEE
ncbi:protein FAM81B [Gadus macrocephalus]|uniref:protein FAM81B n=1 Tax=Gadus macrocephalus TaxID=80720 RepID=UPI0028CB6FBB|nr:protein FAM81B [Gadus macrocephalus]